MKTRYVKYVYSLHFWSQTTERLAVSGDLVRQETVNGYCYLDEKSELYFF